MDAKPIVMLVVAGAVELGALALCTPASAPEFVSVEWQRQAARTYVAEVAIRPCALRGRGARKPAEDIREHYARDDRSAVEERSALARLRALLGDPKDEEDDPLILPPRARRKVRRILKAAERRVLVLFDLSGIDRDLPLRRRARIGEAHVLFDVVPGGTETYLQAGQRLLRYAVDDALAILEGDWVEEWRATAFECIKRNTPVSASAVLLDPEATCREIKIRRLMDEVSRASLEKQQAENRAHGRGDAPADRG